MSFRLALQALTGKGREMITVVCSIDAGGGGGVSHMAGHGPPALTLLSATGDYVPPGPWSYGCGDIYTIRMAVITYKNHRTEMNNNS